VEYLGSGFETRRMKTTPKELQEPNLDLDGDHMTSRAKEKAGKVRMPGRK
jgi:hypothetical protein